MKEGLVSWIETAIFLFQGILTTKRDIDEPLSYHEDT